MPVPVPATADGAGQPLRIFFRVPGMTAAWLASRGMSSRDMDAEILTLRHQLSVLQRQLDPGQTRLTPSDRALPTALLHRLPRDVLK